MAQAKKKTAKKAKPARSAAKKSSSSKKTTAAKKRTAPKRKTINKTAKPKVLAKTSNSNKSQTMETIMSKGKSQFDKLATDATKSNKEQIDAVMQSGNIFMKGLEDIAKTYMGWAQASTEKNTQALKSMLSCKSINEYTETHNKWIQQNFDDFMSGATKISELSVKISTEALEPINDQMSKSVKKAAESIAA